MIKTINDKGTFLSNEKPTAEVFGKYAKLVPESMINVWKELGFGTLLNGYLKIINPDNFLQVLNNSFESAKETSIPLFVTAMADMLVFHNNYLYFLDFRHGNFEVVAKDLKYFFEDIFDKDFLKEELLWEPFTKAKEELGELTFDECYGYEPVLAAGGSEKIENLKKVKIIEHIELIVQFSGKI
jgi:hypothetical protein